MFLSRVRAGTADLAGANVTFLEYAIRGKAVTFFSLVSTASSLVVVCGLLLLVHNRAAATAGRQRSCCCCPARTARDDEH